LLVLTIPAMAQTPPAQPNAGTFVEISASYDVNGSQDNRATVVGVRVPVTSRWSGQFRSILAPRAGNDGVNFNLAEVRYDRNLSDLIKSRSAQVNPGRFELFAYGGAGSARGAMAKDNASFAWSAGGGLNLRINDTVVITLFDYNYVRSRVERAGVVLSSNHQLSPGLSIRFCRRAGA